MCPYSLALCLQGPWFGLCALTKNLALFRGTHPGSMYPYSLALCLQGPWFGLCPYFPGPLTSKVHDQLNPNYPRVRLGLNPTSLYGAMGVTAL